MDVIDKDKQKILQNLKFDDLEKINFKDISKVWIFNVTKLNTKQKRRITEYIAYKQCYSFNCNFDLFPIKEKIYVCKKCNKKYTYKDFTWEYNDCFLKCQHYDPNKDPEFRFSSSIYYEDDEEWGKTDCDFYKFNHYNAIVMSAIKINNNKAATISATRLRLAINTIPDIEIYSDQLVNIQNMFSGSNKIYKIIKN
jgi:hypothetical protein